MKRIIGLFLLVAFLIAIPAAHMVQAKKDLVEICHYDKGGDVGHFIWVSDNGKSLSKHFTHGDCYAGDVVWEDGDLCTCD